MAKAKEGKQPRSATRYSARARLETGGIQEIGTGTDLAELTRQLKQLHNARGLDVWIWRLRDGVTVFAITAALVQKAGAR